MPQPLKFKLVRSKRTKREHYALRSRRPRQAMSFDRRPLAFHHCPIAPRYALAVGSHSERALGGDAPGVASASSRSLIFGRM